MFRTDKDIKHISTTFQQTGKAKITLVLKVILYKIQNITKSFSIQFSKRLVFQEKVLCFAK